MVTDAYHPRSCYLRDEAAAMQPLETWVGAETRVLSRAASVVKDMPQPRVPADKISWLAFRQTEKAVVAVLYFHVSRTERKLFEGKAQSGAEAWWAPPPLSSPNMFR